MIFINSKFCSLCMQSDHSTYHPCINHADIDVNLNEGILVHINVGVWVNWGVNHSSNWTEISLDFIRQWDSSLFADKICSLRLLIRNWKLITLAQTHSLKRIFAQLSLDLQVKYALRDNGSFAFSWIEI